MSDADHDVVITWLVALIALEVGSPALNGADDHRDLDRTRSGVAVG